MHRTEFESLVEKALEQISMHFRHVMQNVAILVEERPDSVVVEEIMGCRDELVYGLFSGTPLSEQHIEDNELFLPEPRSYICLASALVWHCRRKLVMGYRNQLHKLFG